MSACGEQSDKQELRGIVDECFESTAIVDHRGDPIGPGPDQVVDRCIEEQIRHSDLPLSYLESYMPERQRWDRDQGR